jgi:sigma-E factor negative regulatory protein RseA
MNTDMEADPNQDLSALLDGELDPERSRFLLQRLGRDDEMRQRWARWQLVSACLKGQAVRPLPADFAERVLAGLDIESQTIRSRPNATRRWIGGAALAASVGLAALLLHPFTPSQQPVAIVPQATPQVAIQLIRIPLPEPRLELELKLPIPVHAGVVSTYRSPLHPVAISAPQHTQAARFLPLPQPYAIDPELEAYLAQQKSSAGSGNRDVFSEHNVYLPTGNENAMGTVSWSPDDRR